MVPPRTGAPEITVPHSGTVATYGDGQCILTRWTLSAAELDALLSGEDLYISFLTEGKPMYPMGVQVGPANWMTP